MDKITLKREIKKVISALNEDGQPLTFVAISPVFEELVDTSFILKVYADWLDKMTTYDALGIIIAKMYSVLAEDVLRYINRVELCDKNGDFYGERIDVILNEAEIEVG